MEEFKQRIQTGYYYACVIKDNRYHEFVLVNEYDDNTEEVYSYTLQDDESLVTTKPPVMKVNAESNGFISPIWNGENWVESASEEEIKAWNEEHPVPVVEPTKEEQLRADVDFIAAMTGIEL